MTLSMFISKKRCLIIFVSSIFFYFSIVFFCTGVLAEELNENELYSKSAVLTDGKTGRVLFEKNGYDEMPMASTTKIMTCIIALENASLDTVVEVSEYAASMPAVDLGMKAGEKYVLEDLLYSLMLESHNDTAVAIAEGVAGSVEDFADMMNDKAYELGCDDTYFITPNGLDESVEDETGVKQYHHTTAENLAKIMSYCINESHKKEEFINITRKASYSFSDCSGKRQFSCNNHNSFLTMMDGALSGKTGFTNKAGYCYVGSLRQENKDFVVALLACGWPNNKSYKWSDTKKLMEYGLDNYESKKIDVPYEIISFKVEGGQYNIESDNNAFSTAEVSISEDEFLISENEQVDVQYEVMEYIEAPVKKGDKIGEIIYYIEGQEVYNGDISAEYEIKKISYSWAVRQLMKIVF